MIKYIVSAYLLIKLSYGLIPPPIDCAAVSCLLPNCAPDEILYTPEGKCCPKCYKEGDNCGRPGRDCAAIKAPSYLCPDGKTCWGNCGECTFEKYVINGKLECSPWKPKKRVCSNTIDCTAVLCLKPVCGPNEELFVPKGQCCPICKPKLDCRVVLCLQPNCGPDEELYTAPGACCAQCIPKPNPDCRAVLCLQPICGPNEEEYIPKGECCPKCRPKPKPDCTAVFCLKPICGPNEELYTPKGECCPKCRAKIVFCTKDAKQCGDGSFVGRDPNNNCQFFPCPNDNKKCGENECRDGIGQCVDGSIVNCKVAPCLINNGGCRQGQLCTDNYCNGCNAICDKCPSDTHCIDGLNNCVRGDIFNCFINPCQINNGGCDADKECWSNYCNGCNAICKPKCNDLECRNYSNGECQTKTCMLDPCNNIKDPCPGQLCKANTCSNPICKTQCIPCPTLTHYINENNRCIPYN